MPTAVCTRCQRCDQPLTPQGRGRPRKFCTACVPPGPGGAKAWRVANPDRVAATKAQQRHPPKTCQDCGASFPATARSGRCAGCCQKAKAKRRRARQQTPEGRARNRIKNNRRRLARKNGDVTPEQMAPLLRKRKCPLCRVYMTNDAAKPTSREIDHIVPLNVGGTDTIENLRALCRACNNRRPRDGSDYTGPIALWATDPAVAGREHRGAGVQS